MSRYTVVDHPAAPTSNLLRDGKLIATFQSHLTRAECAAIAGVLNERAGQNYVVVTTFRIDARKVKP